MFTKFEAIVALVENPSFILEEDNSITWLSIDKIQPTEEEIQAKIAELEAAEPLRLLRIERNRLLQETDWEITRGLEEGLNIDSLKTYRTALRNLPQQIEAGEITAPTLNDNGMLVFEHWPERTDA